MLDHQLRKGEKIKIITMEEIKIERVRIVSLQMGKVIKKNLLIKPEICKNTCKRKVKTLSPKIQIIKGKRLKKSKVNNNHSMWKQSLKKRYKNEIYIERLKFRTDC